MPRLLWGLLPLATIDVVLFLVPMVIMALFSLRFSEELLGLTGRWTVAHYIKVFTSEGIYLHILVKTIVIALIATAACLLVGYPFAYFIASTSRRWQGVLLTLVIMPFWTSYLLRVYAWTARGSRLPVGGLSTGCSGLWGAVFSCHSWRLLTLPARLRNAMIASHAALAADIVVV